MSVLDSHSSQQGNREPGGNGGKVPALAQHAFQRVDFTRFQPATSVQLIARDAFVADVAVKLDQLHGQVMSLVREIEHIQLSLAELRADTDRNYRFSAFQEDERRARAERFDEIMRRHNELKTRLDAIDGKTNGDCHFYNSFESVSRKLTELGEIQREFRNVQLKLKLSAGLFCASVLLWLFVVISG